MPLSADDKLTLEEAQAKYLRNQDQAAQQKLGDAAMTLARVILETCPGSVERTRSLGYLDAAIVFAHAAITRHGE